jgi:hypothetical protein
MTIMQQATVPKKQNSQLEPKHLFIIIMQALAITASFIPLLLVAAYPIWAVLGVLAVQFMYWYNLNALTQQRTLTKNRAEGHHKKSDSIERDLKILYKLVKNATNKKGEKINPQEIKQYINTLYLNKRHAYLKKKHGVKEDQQLTDEHLKCEIAFKDTYAILDNTQPNDYGLTQIEVGDKACSAHDYITSSKAWLDIVAKHNLKLANNKSIREAFVVKFPALQDYFPQDWGTDIYSQSIETVADRLGAIAAFFGNALGCTGSGFMITALLRSIPLFVSTASTYAPILLTPALPLALAGILAWCGFFAHYYNTVPAIKQAMKEALYFGPSEDKLDLRTGVKYFSYFAGIVMAGAISTINFLTGQFIAWLLMNPANVSGLTTAAMTTLAAPATLAGVVLGSISAAVTFIGLLCLFSKYVPLGVLGLFDQVCKAIDKFKKSMAAKDESTTQFTAVLSALTAAFSEDEESGSKTKVDHLATALSYALIALFVFVVTYFATASICYFVAAVIGPQYVNLTAVCGALMYFNQSFDIGKEIFSVKAFEGYYTKACEFANPSSLAPKQSTGKDATQDEIIYEVFAKT